jgi:hypothetical protein
MTSAIDYKIIFENICGAGHTKKVLFLQAVHGQQLNCCILIHIKFTVVPEIKPMDYRKKSEGFIIGLSIR